MYKRSLLLFVLFFYLFPGNILAQSTRLKITFDNYEKYIPAIVRNTIVYIPSKDFAEALQINYYINKTNHKTEYKFADFKLKFSANNTYIIKTVKNESDEVIQLPVPAIYAANQVYIPIDFVFGLIKEGYSNKLNFNGESLVLSVAAKRKTAQKPVSEPAETEKEKEPEKEKEKTTKPAEDQKAGISISDKANGALVTVRLAKKNVKLESSVKNNVLTLLLENYKSSIAEVGKTSAKSIIKDVKIKKQNANTQVLFEMRQGYESYEITPGDDGQSLLITIRNNKFAHKNTPDKKGKWEFDVIVIDAGHGGKDYGAIGLNGLREKDVNLAIALKLGKLIEKNLKDVKVVYTRKDDTFVELYKRGRIANEKNGKLFISIHCNSTPKKPSDATGTEIYLLRPGRTESAIKIAERENSVIKYEDNPSKYQKLTDENFILVSMAHSSYMKYSEKFSDYLNTNFMNVVQLKSRGVKQAGFYVLVGASMPGILFESGFISNKNDAKFLGSPEGQTKISTSIFEAVKKFKDYYDKDISTES